MPEPTSEISEELKEMIIPELKDHLDPDSWQYIPQMFSQVVYTYPEGVPLVTLWPVYNFPAMQFNCNNGQYVGLTTWDYIQTVDADAQQRENEAREAKELLESVLMYYHKTEYNSITDYDKVIDHRVEMQIDGQTIYKYNCPAQTIYLDTNHYPITYDKQKVDNEYYYYCFDDIDDEITDDDIDRYKYKIPYEWKRTSIYDE